ncbi:MFS transporter [Acinetobacter sp. ME22]|uniref:MFS transporter n=1 Tax=Acinetobacter sp. ME22 TaxID=2904802 RepID=UPI001EDB7412|nr:MFS transporter [Acinetobacter sp. ME22]MCG2574088.1 MFS transporter [Acinetobacter sp. ME22]
MLFRSLIFPNFRNYFIGHTLSTLGTWIQQVALAWLVYQLTHSPALLGLSSFLALFPQLVVSPLVGAVIDTLNKRIALIVVQALFLIQALLLAYLTYFNLLSTSSIIALALFLGLLTAIDTPLRQSFISELIQDRQYIGNALALNAMIFNSCRFIGPPIAGLLLAVSNPFTCFVFNAVSYLFLMLALLLMRNIQATQATGKLRQVFQEGYGFIFKNQDYKRMMIGIACLNFTASSYVALLPILAKDYLHGDAKILGYLWGMAGVGSLLSSLLLAGSQNDERIHQRIFYSKCLCGLGLIFLSTLNLFSGYLLALFLLGFGISTANVSTNILIQKNTPAELRGRSVSIYTAIRFGFDALGGLIAGAIASLYSAKWALFFFTVLLCLYLLHQLPQHISGKIKGQTS